MARWCFLVFFTLTWSQVPGQSPQYELKEGKVSLKPSIPGQPDGILWKHNGNKVVEFNSNEQQVYDPFSDRITLDWVSAELEITDLRPEDSGEYELEVDVGKKLHRSSYKLEVIDKVTEPTISCKMNDSASSAELECSSEPSQSQSLMKFEWRTPENKEPGPKLKIPLGDEHDDKVYSCNVSNPRSTETATFTAKDCYPEKSSSVALIASLVSIFALLVLVGLGIYWCILHKKARFAKGDVEKQSPQRPTEGSDNYNASERLLRRETTLPSNQRLRQLNQAHNMDKEAEEPLAGRSPGKEDETPRKGLVKDKITFFQQNPDGQTPRKTENHTHWRSASPPPSLTSESLPPGDQNNLPSYDDGDVDADQNRDPAEEEVKQNNPSDSERSEPEPEPAGVSDKINEDVRSDVEDSITPEKTADDMDEEAAEPLAGRSPACDADKEDETPRKGSVKDKVTLFDQNADGQTPRKTENHTHGRRSASPPPSLTSKSLPPGDQNNLPSYDDGDVDADQNRDPAEEEVKQNNPSDSERSEPEPAGVSDKINEDVQSDVEDSITPEKTETEAGEDAESSPAAKPHIVAAERFPDPEPEDSSGEHEEDADSHQVTGGAVENNVRDSAGREERRHESDDSREDKLSPNEQRGSGTLISDLKREEADTNIDNQQETVKPVSEDETEEEDSGDLYSADTSHPDPDRGEEEEPETNRDSHESEAQSDRGNGETAEGKNEAQHG